MTRADATPTRSNKNGSLDLSNLGKNNNNGQEQGLVTKSNLLGFPTTIPAISGTENQQYHHDVTPPRSVTSLMSGSSETSTTSNSDGYHTSTSPTMTPVASHYNNNNNNNILKNQGSQLTKQTMRTVSSYDATTSSSGSRSSNNTIHDTTPPRMLDLTLPHCTPSPVMTDEDDEDEEGGGGGCVDCGCSPCVCDFEDHRECYGGQQQQQQVPVPPAGTDNNNKGGRKARVHSINLGEVEAQLIDDMFADPKRRLSNCGRLSSKALTIANEDASELLSCCELQSQPSLVVRKLDESHEGVGNAAESGKFSNGGEDDLAGDDHPKKPLPRTDRFGGGCRGKWASSIHLVHEYTAHFLRKVTRVAATYPKTTVAVITVFSFFMLIVGFFTNFEVELDNWYLWPPQSSKSSEFANWFYYQSEFQYDTSYFDMILHARGENVLGVEGIRRTFEAIEAITELDGYKEGCLWAQLFGEEYYLGECKIHSVADFWNESLAVFEEEIQSDSDAILAMSVPNYPNGIYVDESRILGNAIRISDYGADDDTYTRLESAQSYLIEFDLPWTNVTEEFEWRAMERIVQLQEEWDAQPNNIFTIEYKAQRSFSDEFSRSIVTDMPLLPFVFVIMAGFCCFVFWKRDRVQSRMLLGVGAVVCILLSIFTAYGFMFCFGVPFTTVTTMMPFLMFGVGLDDAFILYGSYNRTDPRLSPIDRVMVTIDDVGVSISLTTVTSAFAFFTGVFSTIPAVSWLCWYAGVAIIIDFIYQVTFFIALIVLDERRIAANRLDICFCSKRDHSSISVGETFEETDSRTQTQEASTPSSDASAATDDNGARSATQTTYDTERAITVRKQPRRQSRKIPKISQEAHFADRFMYWFAKKLLLRKVQAFVVVLFFFVLMASVVCATSLRQKFNYVDMVPNDSYMKKYHKAEMKYASRNGMYTYIYFRDVDQSDPEIQEQMMEYVEDLTNSGAINQYPVYFWLRDFKTFVKENEDTLGDLSFEEQIATFLKDPGWEDLYDQHIVIDKETGGVTQSRCDAFIEVDMQSTKAGTVMLNEMREVDSRQPINNDGRDRWAFVTYGDDYHVLEFYNVVVEELINTTVMGVVAVTIVALILIPHWSAALFVLPFITFLYIDMLGFLYFSGVNVNAISYITLIMSIGLMVDFIMHILLRYFESKGTREQRVVDTLSTMGASILVGAISTFLGVMLLVFSTSEVIKNVFVSFIGIACFGVMHGLVFLPTILAMVGPE